jgi:hypothetical protein
MTKNIKFICVLLAFLLTIPSIVIAGQRRSMPAPIADKFTVDEEEYVPPKTPKYVDIYLLQANTVTVKKGQKIRLSTKNIQNMKYWSVKAPKSVGYKGITKVNGYRCIILSPKEVGYFTIEILGKPKKSKLEEFGVYQKKLNIQIKPKS